MSVGEPSPPYRPEQVAFRRIFYIVASVLVMMALFGVLLLTGSVLAAFVAAAMTNIGIANGMVWGAYRVTDGPTPNDPEKL